MKLLSDEVTAFIRDARERVPVHSTWLHYKGGCYTIVGHALDTETSEVVVQYRRIGGPGFNAIDERDVVYSRPVSHWSGAHAVLIANTRRFTRID